VKLERIKAYLAEISAQLKAERTAMERRPYQMPRRQKKIWLSTSTSNQHTA